MVRILTCLILSNTRRLSFDTSVAASPFREHPHLNCVSMPVSGTPPPSPKLPDAIEAPALRVSPTAHSPGLRLTHRNQLPGSAASLFPQQCMQRSQIFHR
jgi:hypothetical protein